VSSPNDGAWDRYCERWADDWREQDEASERAERAADELAAMSDEQRAALDAELAADLEFLRAMGGVR
jgi:hypothetical protein